MLETSAATASVPALGRLRAATVVTKPWGRELWYSSGCAAAQILDVKEGQDLMLKPRAEGAETICLLSGSVWFHLNGHSFEVIPGAYLPLKPGDVCGLHALEDAMLLVVRSARTEE